MDARSPLSPRASAFSIASLVAAEAVERTAHQGSGSSDRVKLRWLPGSPAGMHFSTVTRDMEDPLLQLLWGPGAEKVEAALARVGSRLLAATAEQRGRAGIPPKAYPPTSLRAGSEVGTQVDPGPEEGQ
ncbi:hypothetical protein P7K49_003098 [Saguinus oedipus]|uniref:Uncharacterized protein n=1 Tax=Saguinus oedipus TaxID=9490 RepID=A0ABQ9WJ78_SAGOE|nr:hypothetical protein P7K49_003098 [Saguinus oedipus]